MLIEQTLEKLRVLRLTGMRKALEQQMTVEDVQTLSFDDRFGLLVDNELVERDSRNLASRLKAANLKEQACIENINFRKARGIDKGTVLQLATCAWLKANRNLLIDGPTGIGKTYLGCALAHRACQHGFSTLYIRAPRLFNDLQVARVDGSYNKFLSRLAKIKLLVIDDFGLMVLNDDTARDFLEVIDDRNGLASTMLLSQLPTDQWHGTIANATLADAILDRVVHNSYKLKLKGPSMRKELTSDGSSEDDSDAR